MKDQRVLAHCNLFGVLGAIPYLLKYVPEARECVKDKDISLGFVIKDGPSATLVFKRGRAKMVKGAEKCSIKLYFPSPEKFNKMIDGTGMPIPISGFHHVGFLLKNFTALTDILSKYLRPTKEDLEDKRFYTCSTVVMFHVIVSAIAEIGNEDKIGSFSASNIVDGTVKLAIGEKLALGVEVKDHKLTAIHTDPEECFSEMRFESIKIARDLFDGNINAVAAVGEGKVRICGMISQVDNINRILDRVSVYLA